MNARIEALVKQIERVRWLAPEAGEGELSSVVRARVEDRVAAFGQAMARQDKDFKPPGLRVFRCAEELCAAFLSGWAGAASQRDAWRFQEVLRGASAQRWMESDEELQEWRERLDLALAGSLARSDAARRGVPVADPPFARIARAELAWLARDDDIPSPWGPLLDLWTSGMWPVWLPSGELAVYVPVRRGGALAWAPDSPTYLELPAVAGEIMTPFKMDWTDWRYRQKDALMTVPRYRVAAAAEDLLAVFDGESVHPWVFPLRKDEVIVGRTPDNPVALFKGSVSKRHCALLRSEGRWFVGDLGSAAGTLRNGAPVRDPELLEPGDRVTLCGFTLCVLQPGDVAVLAGPLVDEPAG